MQVISGYLKGMIVLLMILYDMLLGQKITPNLSRAFLILVVVVVTLSFNAKMIFCQFLSIV